jgi:DNA-binding GntR family transcriptional regulator
MRRQPTKPTPPPSISEKIASQIRADIRDGRLLPGERVTEAQLTSQHKVSRGPVREALRHLETDGILTFEKNRGVSVRRLTRGDFVHMLEVREALEGLAARLLAPMTRGGGAVQQLTALFKRMGKAVAASDLERYNQDLYVRFHSLLVAASENPVLLRQWSQLNLDIFRQQFRPLVNLNLVRVAHEEHQGLLSALHAHDPKQAEECARQHVAHFTEFVRRLPDRLFESANGYETPPNGRHANRRS